jgi:hypothetical protein
MGFAGVEFALDALDDPIVRKGTMSAFERADQKILSLPPNRT